MTGRMNGKIEKEVFCEKERKKKKTAKIEVKYINK